MINKIYKVGIYIRLSREDGDNLESESVKNQRTFLHKYLEESTDFILTGEYVDDGYSGSNFNRPAWLKLLNDIDNKKIDTIITKDLSRMGRDYISMGNYIERVFPENSIRYIAVNDDIDTLYETPGLEFLQFKLVFNDYYLKDTSKKIRKIIKTKKQEGQFLGWKAVYGYKKDPNNKYKLIIDENVRHVVKYMFDLALQGNSPRQIANILNKEKIPNPSSYAGLNRGIKTSSYKLWCPRTINDMLSNETYIGNLTQGKRKKITYKSEKEIRLPKEEWIITENTHEPIIDKNTFSTVNNILKKNKNKVNNKNVYMLSGFMYCKECGHAIGINKSSDKKRKYTVCTYYASHSKYKLCTPHSNNYDKLEKIVLENLKQLCNSNIDKDKFKREIKEELKKKSLKTKIEKEINVLEVKMKKNLNYIDKIYEDKLNGEITKETFQRLTIKYQKENELKKKEIKELQEKLTNIIENNEKETLNKIDNFLSFQKLDRNLLVNLIDKIIIDKDKNIKIYYKFNA